MQRWMKTAAASAALSVLGLAGASWSQDDEVPSPCEEVCYDDEERCYQGCEDAAEPDDCEAVCTAQAEECLAQCD